ncbi:MAG: hypothetical protein ABIZ80_14070, partial [Bryobacteraceae bacterium]
MSQLTPEGNFDTEPAISRDGNDLAFASDRNGEGHLDIWIQKTGTSSPRRLTRHPADDREPAFSPDGATVVFRSEREGGGIYAIPANGGDERLIARDGRRPRVSPDGHSVAYWVGAPDALPNTEGDYQIFAAPVDGGEPRQMLPHFSSASYPVWAPDGQHLLFLGRPDPSRDPADTPDWWLAPIGKGEPKKTGICQALRLQAVLAEGSCPPPAAWEGRNVFFSSTRAGIATNLWAVEINAETLDMNSKATRITSGDKQDTAGYAAASNRIVFSRQHLAANIWTLAVDADEGTVKGDWKRLTSDAGYDVYPSSTADGSTMLFQSSRGGTTYHPWQLDRKSGKESPAASTIQEQLWPRISPDGSKVAFSELRHGKYESFYAGLTGGHLEILCEDCGPVVSDWSKDGKRVLIDYMGSGKSHMAVALMKLGSLDRIVVVQDDRYNLMQARFSPDEKRIAFASRIQAGRSRLYVAPLGNSSTPKENWVALTDGKSWDTAPQWSPNGKLLY